MDDLLAKQAKVPAAKIKTISEMFGFQTEENKLVHGFQQHAENAIYANPRIRCSVGT